ncbi:hypothetical protein D9613_011977 [Agrocybe pediades]|uniref:Nephrocystin 3-like N-terminal domain-containing protein n=1 Tax=Agrocybe pediades TaxID=84607 RepID=A0A8H4VHU0_9AGAR|nr:hypothetical protein D9613_011977 [Agrocybe pediades]
MAQKPPAGKIKNFFADLGRHLRPDSSPNPSRSPSPNPNPTPPTDRQEQPEQRNIVKDYGATVWKATEMALRLLEKNADGFPPLKTAIGALVTCLDVAKDVIGNREEYTKLAVQFKDTASALEPYASKLAASDARGSIALILKSIDEEVAEINRKLERGKFKRAVEATDDQGDILARYHKIDSLFRRLLSDVTLRTYVEIEKLRKATDETLLRTLVPVDDARYNSAYSTAVKRRACTASTRAQILDDLRTWVKDPNGSKVFWMNGMAGTGKTTILYSFSKWLEDDKRLAGNFFCSRASALCGDLNNITRSIAYQLAHYSPAFRSELCKILEEKQNPHALYVGEQFKWVVATPLEKSKDAIPDGAAIVIDALDECNNTSATASFLQVLLSYATDLPIKFLVASRPEPVILKNMQTPNFSHSVLRLHDIEQSLIEADIKLYLQEALSTVSPVPPPDVIDQLTRQSGKLFIYAATVARYVNPEDKVVNSETRLGAILGISSSSPSLQEQELDKLYMTILLSAFDKDNFEKEELETASLILRIVICAIEPMTTSTMSTILALRQGDVTSALSRLQSVLHVQEGTSGLVSVLHASFPDFLCDKARSHEFHCDTIEHNTKLAHSCFDVMSKEFHNLESSYDSDSDVPDLEEKIQANISAALLYACKYWSNHLVHCDLTTSIHSKLLEFLKFRLSFWMEVLRLTKPMSMVSIISNTLAWFTPKALDHTFKETEKELYYAELFVNLTCTPVYDARYNSEYSTVVKRHGCTASTRAQILDDLEMWVKDPQGTKVFWMNGLAGTGKTTILYSLCKRLEKNQRLAANFFCSQASTACCDLSNIVGSVAYQLAHYSPAFRSQLRKILEREKQNPHMLNVGEQFKLIMESLQNSKDVIPDGVVIVIDALDECGNVSVTTLFLKVLMTYATHLPIKFLFASRPESVILKNMQAPNFSPSILRLHDTEQSLVEADIRVYLRKALYTMSPRPSSEVIAQLATRSGKLFIYAATVVRYINPEGINVDSQKRLKTILGMSSSSPNLQYQGPGLDNLYTGILSSAFDRAYFKEEELDIATLVLRTVICAIEPMTISTMSMILALEQEDVASTLSRLRSVLHVQQGPSGLVSILHPSFPDFLFNKDRSQEFYCNIVEHNTKLAHSCFDVMSKEFHNLESSYDSDSDVPDLEEKIQANISAALLYACKYWGDHLVHCNLTEDIHYKLLEFLEFRLSFWMEVLKLTKCISKGSQMLSNVLAWLTCKAPNHTFKETEKKLYDAELFVKTFSSAGSVERREHAYYTNPVLTNTSTVSIIPSAQK